MNRVYEAAHYYLICLLVAISLGFAAFTILTLVGHQEFYASINREIVWIPLGFIAGTVAVSLRARFRGMNARNYAA